MDKQQISVSNRIDSVVIICHEEWPNRCKVNTIPSTCTGSVKWGNFPVEFTVHVKALINETIFSCNLQQKRWWEHCETGCKIFVTWFIVHRIPQHCQIRNWGIVYSSLQDKLGRGNFVRSLSRNGIVLQVAEKIALCNSILKSACK